MDTVSKEKRSWVMSRIHSVDTGPEMLVRSYLFSRGLRFRVHAKNLPGHPDIALRKYKTVVEVRGCFWHRHPGCKVATTPKSNIEFWQEKFDRNTARDRRNEAKYDEMGWRLLVVWECELRPVVREQTLAALYDRIVGTPAATPLTYPAAVEPDDVPVAAESADGPRYGLASLKFLQNPVFASLRRFAPSVCYAGFARTLA